MKSFNPNPYLTILFLALAFGAALLTIALNLAITQPLLLAQIERILK